MENRINISELLKDCPEGMELYSPLFGNCKFIKVHDYEAEIIVEIETGATVSFKTDGRYYDYPNAECILFPKGKKTWEGFVPPCKFKDGDVVATKLGSVFILKNSLVANAYSCYVALNHESKFIHKEQRFGHKDLCRFATEKEKQKLFQAIKANGYHWNPETKTLEKVIKPKFKVGNMIQDIDVYRVKITEVNIEDECYEYESIITKGIGSIPFSEQDNWELIPNKFDISALRPFESRVLVRNAHNKVWRPTIFGCYMKDKYEPFYVLGGTGWKQCIPYEGNEHLLGTTDDCDEFYKNW